jgi:predicted PurR-regulated permease PerM
MDKRLEQIIQVSAIALLVIGCLLVLRPFVAAILTAAILCYATWPVYRWIEYWAWGRRGIAAFVMTVLIIVVLVLPLALVAILYGEQLPHLVERGRELLAQDLPGPPDWIAAIPLIGEQLDAAWRDLATNREKLDEAIARLAQPAREVLIQAGIVIAEGVLQFTLTAFISYFFFRDGAAIAAAVTNMLDRVAGRLSSGVLQTVGGTTDAVVYGILGTGVAQGIAAAIGFTIAGVPGALILGFLTFFLSIFPGGTPIAWIGPTLWLLYQDQIGWAIFMALWGFIVIGGIDNIAKPLLISRGSRLSLLLVLLGVLGGVLAFGFIGIFLGPTLLAVGFNLVRHWVASQPGAAAP